MYIVHMDPLPTQDYTIVNNGIFYDEALSWKAKGLIGAILSMKGGGKYQFTAESLAKMSADGVSSIQSGLEELYRAGYLVKERLVDSLGQVYKWQAQVFRQPQGFAQPAKAKKEKKAKAAKNTTPAPICQAPIPPFFSNPDLDFPHLEKHPPIKTDLIKTEIKEKEVVEATATFCNFQEPGIPEIISPVDQKPKPIKRSERSQKNLNDPAPAENLTPPTPLTPPSPPAPAPWKSTDEQAEFSSFVANLLRTKRNLDGDELWRLMTWIISQNNIGKVTGEWFAFVESRKAVEMPAKPMDVAELRAHNIEVAWDRMSEFFDSGLTYVEFDKKVQAIADEFYPDSYHRMFYGRDVVNAVMSRAIEAGYCPPVSSMFAAMPAMDPSIYARPY